MEVTKCILSCKDGCDLVNFGSFFERYVILPCEFSLPFSLPGCQVNVSSFLSSQEVQRSNARFQRALVKAFLGGCEGSGESRYSRGPKNYRDAKDRVSKQANFTPHCISLLTFHRLSFEITGDVLQRVSSTLTSQRIHRRNLQSTQSVLTSFQRLRSLV